MELVEFAAELSAALEFESAAPLDAATVAALEAAVSTELPTTSAAPRPWNKYVSSYREESRRIYIRVRLTTRGYGAARAVPAREAMNGRRTSLASILSVMW